MGAVDTCGRPARTPTLPLTGANFAGIVLLGLALTSSGLALRRLQRDLKDGNNSEVMHQLEDELRSH